MASHYIACDLGAESGRMILGSLEAGRLSLDELHRFPNGATKVGSSLHWDMPHLFAEVKAGLRKAAARRLTISSISTDSWGVDYLLYDAHGAIMTPVFHYRDGRTVKGVENARAKVSWEDTFAETGIQFMGLNTLYQLAAEPPERLAGASQMLLVGDAFNHFLCGVGRAEESLASTTQLYNPVTKAWSQKMLAALGLPAKIFPPIVPSGTRLGKLKPELANACGLPQIDVIASCSHDTGAAVAAVPASGKNWAYLSSGTWSLMGVELSQPAINDAARLGNCTNEIGFGGSVRFLKNIIGLWLIQECRRDWSRQGREFTYAELDQMAARAKPFASLINPQDPRFMAPDGMPDRIAAFCKETGQPVPADPGAMIRCICESLALLYRQTAAQIEAATGCGKIEKLHIVGGGSQNGFLNQATANSMQIPVLTGPAECTAAGNILVQAISLGHLPSLEAARAVVRESMQVGTVQPQEKAEWEAVYGRAQTLFGI